MIRLLDEALRIFRGGRALPSAVLAALLGGALAPAAALGPLPDLSAGGSLSVGWRHNLLGSSFAEERGFNLSSADYWFEVDRLNDWVWEAGIWARSELPSFHKKLRVTASYQRVQAAHNPILGSDVYELSLRQKLPHAQRLDLTIGYLPQVYMRHRLDKDAPAGAPQFRPEAYRGISTDLEYRRPVMGLPTAGFLVYENRDESRWFDERDRRYMGAGLSVEWAPTGSMMLRPSYEFGRITSRNRPDLGSDFASLEHAVGLRVRAPVPLPGGPWGLEAGGQAKFRRYTTDNADDSSRFRRHDVSWWWNARMGHPLGRLTPFVAVEQTGRRISLPPGADASDEDGEYDGSLVRIGTDWEF